MAFTSASRAFWLVMILSGCFAAVASAQNAPAAQPSAEPPPVAEPGTTVQAQCIEENDTFELRGKKPALVIALENKCETRMKCRVFAYVTSAKGVGQGQGTLRLAPKSHGAAAKKSYVMRVKMLGGSSQSTRECGAY